eukprot:scaffold1687_cov405-Prasinococcus_capsulatus_cf.AAC.36
MRAPFNLKVSSAPTFPPLDRPKSSSGVAAGEGASPPTFPPLQDLARACSHGARPSARPRTIGRAAAARHWQAARSHAPRAAWEGAGSRAARDGARAVGGARAAGVGRGCSGASAACLGRQRAAPASPIADDGSAHRAKPATEWRGAHSALNSPRRLGRSPCASSVEDVGQRQPRADLTDRRAVLAPLAAGSLRIAPHGATSLVPVCLRAWLIGTLLAMDDVSDTGMGQTFDGTTLGDPVLLVRRRGDASAGSSAARYGLVREGHASSLKHLSTWLSCPHALPRSMSQTLSYIRLVAL